jgi:hypothetical protein
VEIKVAKDQRLSFVLLAMKLDAVVYAADRKKSIRASSHLKNKKPFLIKWKSIKYKINCRKTRIKEEIGKKRR